MRPGAVRPAAFPYVAFQIRLGHFRNLLGGHLVLMRAFCAQAVSRKWFAREHESSKPCRGP